MIINKDKITQFLVLEKNVLGQSNPSKFMVLGGFT